jgi:hypothetical protein
MGGVEQTTDAESAEKGAEGAALRQTAELGWDGCALQGYEALGLTAGVAEAGEIALHLLAGGEGFESGVEDGEGGGVVGGLDAIVHPLAFAASVDDACAAEVGEVAGDLGLGLLEDFDEVADADLAVIHEVEQTEAGGVGEGCEEEDRIEGFGGASHDFKYTP